MKCCHAQLEGRPERKWWRGASGCAGSGALLMLLPKCPMCIAAYLALWTGASVAMPVASHLRFLLEIVLVASVVLFFAGWGMARRTRHNRVSREEIAMNKS
jgi:ACR3 family arsenite efflux pump ArsB